MDKSPSDALGTLKDTLEATREPFEIGEDRAHRTIKDAYDNAMSSDTPPLLKPVSTYDPEQEQYPIEFHGTPDREWLPFTLDGHGVGTALGHEGVEGDILQIHAPTEGGQGCYKKPAILRNVSLQGGDGGAQIHIAGVPNGRIRDVVATGPGIGVQWTAPFLEDMVPDSAHSFGWDLHGVTAWGCQTGFRAGRGASIHSTGFTQCRANNCRGAGVAISGAANIVWRGGDSQLNGGFGFSLRDCEAATIRDAYIEGNGRRKDAKNDVPLEIYGKNADGLTVDGCYFHGINPRTVEHDYKTVQRALNVHESQSAAFTNNLARRYGDGLIASMSGSDVEAHGNQIQDDSVLVAANTSDSTITEYGHPIDAGEA